MPLPFANRQEACSSYHRVVDSEWFALKEVMRSSLAHLAAEFLLPQAGDPKVGVPALPGCCTRSLGWSYDGARLCQRGEGLWVGST